jgi:hypothetical protein
MIRRLAGASLALLLAAGPVAAAPACRGADGHAAEFGGRRTFLLRPDVMGEVKRAGPNAPGVSAAWRAVVERADAALAGPLYSVVAKTRTPPSGDKHDYMSMGPYWWPDPAKAGGEPYVRRDGQVNPERDGPAFDVTALDAMSSAVEALSIAYFLTDDPRYATKAAELVRAWFLAPATRMNPNAQFAQGVPGRTPGRAEGVLDTYRLIRVVEGVGLIAPSGALSPAEEAALRRWFADYADWMTTSANGREEGQAGNNHGLWYDLQPAQFSLFAGRPDVARDVVSRFVEARIAVQTAPDGSLPHELQRTRALHYTVFALQPAAGVADLGRCLGVDVWGATSRNGRSLRAAVDFLLPYVGREAAFPYPERSPGPSDEMLEVFARAALAYGDPRYAEAAARTARRRPQSDLLLTVAPPALATGGGPGHPAPGERR